MTMAKVWTFGIFAAIIAGAVAMMLDAAGWQLNPVLVATTIVFCAVYLCLRIIGR